MDLARDILNIDGNLVVVFRNADDALHLTYIFRSCWLPTLSGLHWRGLTMAVHRHRILWVLNLGSSSDLIELLPIALRFSWLLVYWLCGSFLTRLLKIIRWEI